MPMIIDLVAVIRCHPCLVQVVILIVLSFIHKRIRLFRECLWGFPGIVTYVANCELLNLSEIGCDNYGIVIFDYEICSSKAFSC